MNHFLNSNFQDFVASYVSYISGTITNKFNFCSSKKKIIGMTKIYSREITFPDLKGRFTFGGIFKMCLKFPLEAEKVLQ